MTVEEVKTLRKGEWLHYTGPNGRGKLQPCTRTVGPRGGVTEAVTGCKVSSDVQTWKRDPGRVRVAVKRGMYEHAEITAENCQHFHREADCPLAAE